MYVLEELWLGNINPGVRSILGGSNYDCISKCIMKEEDNLRSKLSNEDKAVYDKLSDMRDTLLDLSERDAFIKGFRLGAKVILDVLGEYPSQLPQIKG